MFTGIIEEVGILKNIKRISEKLVIEIRANKVLEALKLGDSIATNGVCLTVTSFGDDFFTADIMTVTAKKSGLVNLQNGEKLNLERALLITDRLGGHILQGHVDTVGVVNSIIPNKGGYLIKVCVSNNFKNQFVAQGSVGLNGVSLTIAEVSDNSFTVSLIQETLSSTNLGELKVNSKVTVEFDIIGKYINRIFENKENKKNTSNIDMNFLHKYGY